VSAVDALVAGGGPAGSAVALALARAGWETVVVDGRRDARPPLGESLPSAARPLLERLGLLDEFLAGPHRPVVANRSCWGSPEPRDRPALLAPYGHGWHLERESFDAMLRAGAAGAGARFVSGRVRSVRADSGRFELDVGDRAFLARGVVDATGRTAALARRLGATVRRVGRLVAVCSRSADPANGVGEDAVSLVEAAPDGWWYSAPLPGGPYVAQFATLPEHRRARRPLSERLDSAPLTRERVGRLAEEAPLAVGAHSALTQPCAGPGWVAVGDAAVAHDPLASAGLAMALRSAARAAEALAAWLADGDAGLLARYDAMQEAAFTSYLAERGRMYAQERRFGAAPFWAATSASP
jgi:flavin-dependent dehydrogenase